MVKTKQADQTATIKIQKIESYRDSKILISGIDEERLADFNLCKEIEVTAEELKAIGNHRWLEVK